MNAAQPHEHTAWPDGLLLLGSVHHDPRGFQRLSRFLDLYEPDLVLVELSAYGWCTRASRQHELQTTLRRNLREAALRNGIPLREALRHPEIRAIRRQIALPFEFRAAAHYVRRAVSARRIALVDDSRFSRNWITTSWPELIATENLLQLLSLRAPPRPVSPIYAYAARCIAIGQTPAGLDLWKGDAEHAQLWQERERTMAHCIRRALDTFQPRRAVFVGGWWHLTRGGSLPTLRELLDWEPSRCLLLDRFPTGP